MFSLLSGIYFPICTYIYFQMSSVTCFCLEHSIFWFSDNGLNILLALIPHKQILITWYRPKRPTLPFSEAKTSGPKRPGPKRPILPFSEAKTSYSALFWGQNVLLCPFLRPKRPTLPFFEAKTSYSALFWGQNVLLCPFVRPKRPTLPFSEAKTSYSALFWGQNVLLCPFLRPKRPTLPFSEAKTSWAKTSGPKYPGPKRPGQNVRGQNVRAPGWMVWINPVPNNPWFLRVCSTSVLKTL